MSVVLIYILGAAVIVTGLRLMQLIIRELSRADEPWYRSSDGRRLTLPRNPKRKKRGW